MRFNQNKLQEHFLGAIVFRQYWSFMAQRNNRWIYLLLFLDFMGFVENETNIEYELTFGLSGCLSFKM